MKEKLNKWKKTVCGCPPHFSVLITPPQTWNEIRKQKVSAKTPIAPVVKKLSPADGLRAARTELETSLSIELRRKEREGRGGRTGKTEVGADTESSGN